MDKASIAKIIATSCMGIALAALIAIALFSDIPISLQVFAVCAGIYGFFEIRKWAKK
jgi:biotin transporter BioY